jgi:hypothetical protein
MLLRGRLVNRQLPVAGPRPLDELEWVEALVGGGVDAHRSPVPRLSDRVAVLVDEPRLILDRALGELNPG